MIQNVMDWEGERVSKINKIWMLARIENQLKKLCFLRPKLKKITKQTLSKTMVSSLAFFYRFWVGLGRVWGGFWEGFGGFGASLGPLLASFFGAYILNALQKGSWSLLGSILGPFWMVWEGSGERFGRVLEEFGACKIVVFLERVF